MDNNPYLTPNSKIEGSPETTLPYIIYFLSFLAAILALWYLGLDGRKWTIPLSDMSTFEFSRKWLIRGLYAIPKLGLLIGFISLLKFRKYSFQVYLICWLFGIAHSALYFYAYGVNLSSNIEKARVVVHHVIPHVFYLWMLLSLFLYRKSQGRAAQSIT